MNFIYVMGNVTVRGFSELPHEWRSIVPIPIGHHEVPQAVPRSFLTVTQGDRKVRRFDLYPPARSQFTCCGNSWILLTGDTDHCYGVNYDTGDVRLTKLPAVMELGVFHGYSLVLAGAGYVTRVRADAYVIWQRELWCTKLNEPYRLKVRLEGAESPDAPPSEMILDLPTGRTVAPHPPAPPSDAHYVLQDGGTFSRTDCPMCERSGRVEPSGEAVTAAPLVCPCCEGKGYVERPATFGDAIDACGDPLDDVWSYGPSEEEGDAAG